jgi:hypothetical protein
LKRKKKEKRKEKRKEKKGENKMKWPKTCEYQDWRQWFAWYPVITVEGNKVLLEKMWRRCKWRGTKHCTEINYHSFEYTQDFSLVMKD